MRFLVDEDASIPAPPPYMMLGPAYAQPPPTLMPPEPPPPDLETSKECGSVAQPEAWVAGLKPLPADRISKSEVVLYSANERGADAIKLAHGCP